MAFAIKAEGRDPRARTFAFVAQKTMYAGKHVTEGDTIFIFASGNGVVTSAEPVVKKRGIARQAPR